MAKAKDKQPDAWQDIPGQHRPTPERMARGNYRLGLADRQGVKVAIDDASTPLRQALSRKVLTLRQVEAGERYEELHRAVWGGSGSKDSLDMSPRGGVIHETEPQAMRNIANSRKLEGLLTMMDAKTELVLYQIAVGLEPIGDCRPTYKRYRHLVLALDICADFFRL